MNYLQYLRPVYFRVLSVARKTRSLVYSVSETLWGNSLTSMSGWDAKRTQRGRKEDACKGGETRPKSIHLSRKFWQLGTSVPVSAIVLAALEPRSRLGAPKVRRSSSLAPKGEQKGAMGGSKKEQEGANGGRQSFVRLTCTYDQKPGLSTGGRLGAAAPWSAATLATAYASARSSRSPGGALKGLRG